MGSGNIYSNIALQDTNIYSRAEYKPNGNPPYVSQFCLFCKSKANEAEI